MFFLHWTLDDSQHHDAPASPNNNQQTLDQEQEVVLRDDDDDDIYDLIYDIFDWDNVDGSYSDDDDEEDPTLFGRAGSCEEDL